MSQTKLRDKYNSVDPLREITIVMFVHAATDPIPENLLKAVREATQPDKPGARGKHDAKNLTIDLD